MKGVIVTKANIFISRWFLRPERREEFLSIFEPLWRNHIATMEAITNFVFYGWSRDGNVLVAIESYRDENLLGELRKSPDFQREVARMLDCCSQTMTMELFSGLDTDRSVFDIYAQGPSKVHPKGKEIGAVFL
jgi:quinol monooxygenase YgiN